MLKDEKYHDPLHIGYAQLTIKDFEGKERFIINKNLLDVQLCWENLEAIKSAHTLKLLFYTMIEEETNPVMLKELAKDITEVEFELQRLWKFNVDAKYHRFWDTPKCQCPKLDNEEAYSTGYHITNLSCPLHGNEPERSGAV